MVSVSFFLNVCILLTHKIVASVVYIPLARSLQRENILQLQEETFLNTPDLLKNHGYPVETHHVTTDDGYILTLHRIPFGIKSPPSSDKPAVLLQHGHLTNSAELLSSGPEQSLGHYLADLGYDVWLGNTRGTRYSNKHVRFDSDETKYWDFSWADMGYYDVPAMIDHILAVTNQEQIFYIGYSKGTMIFFVMCATRPEYNEKIRLMSAMAPISYLSHISSPVILFISKVWRTLQVMFTMMDIAQYTPSRSILKTIGDHYCNDGNPVQYLCQQFLFYLGGYDEHLNVSLFPTLLEHTPDTIVFKDFEHIRQSIQTDKFRNFDYGTEENLRVYNRTTPPDYNLSIVTAPVALFYSDNDYLSNAADVEQLYQELGNPVAKILIPERINHYSYFYGKHIREILYSKIVELMKYY